MRLDRTTLYLCAILAGFFVIPMQVPAADDEVAHTFTYSGATAKSVGVAGEFSNWNILPMTKDDQGNWTRTVYCKPGFYGYKFVVDGDWVLDPANPTRKVVNDIENSGMAVGGVPVPANAGGISKIPTTFSYTDATAKSVYLAGEFNNWLDNEQGRVTGHEEWMLQNDGAGNWKITKPLAPGRYKFKYVVDGGDRWEKDRTLPSTADDNSLAEVKAGTSAAAPSTPAAPSTGKQGVTFTLTEPNANTVHLAGEFNNWLDNVEGKVTGHDEWLLKKDGAGNWTITAPLAAGRYKFKYVVNGGENWVADPKLPASTDGNSIIEVKAGEGAPPPTSVPAVAPVAQGGTGVAFTYADPSAKSVAVAGDFNQWSATANPLAKDEFGVWSAKIPVKPGRYMYKFVVDGAWKTDPSNPEEADDGFGGKNSVKSVAP